jgi:Ala-tRNA(Pro) deacylase
MAIAQRLKSFLNKHGVPYDLISHEATGDSQHSAQAAHVPGRHLAKAVLLEDEQGYLVAVIPADQHVHLGRVHHLLDRSVGLATEPELTALFPDCEPGAVPPLGTAYGLPMVVDRQLIDAPEVWFEGGDHRTLVHVSGDAFRALCSESATGDITEGA